eukprot:s252_g6.t1
MLDWNKPDEALPITLGAVVGVGMVLPVVYVILAWLRDRCDSRSDLEASAARLEEARQRERLLDQAGEEDVQLSGRKPCACLTCVERCWALSSTAYCWPTRVTGVYEVVVVRELEPRGKCSDCRNCPCLLVLVAFSRMGFELRPVMVLSLSASIVTDHGGYFTPHCASRGAPPTREECEERSARLLAESRPRRLPIPELARKTEQVDLLEQELRAQLRAEFDGDPDEEIDEATFGGRCSLIARSRGIRRSDHGAASLEARADKESIPENVANRRKAADIISELHKRTIYAELTQKQELSESGKLPHQQKRRSPVPFAADPPDSPDDARLQGRNTITPLSSEKKIQILQIKVLSIKGLHSADSHRMPESFCVCELVGKKGTRCEIGKKGIKGEAKKTNTMRYEWNQPFEIKNFEEGDDLSFQIFDYDFDPWPSIFVQCTQMKIHVASIACPDEEVQHCRRQVVLADYKHELLGSATLKGSRIVQQGVVEEDLPLEDVPTSRACSTCRHTAVTKGTVSVQVSLADPDAAPNRQDSFTSNMRRSFASRLQDIKKQTQEEMASFSPLASPSSVVGIVGLTEPPAFARYVAPCRSTGPAPSLGLGSPLPEARITATASMPRMWESIPVAVQKEEAPIADLRLDARRACGGQPGGLCAVDSIRSFSGAERSSRPEADETATVSSFRALWV